MNYRQFMTDLGKIFNQFRQEIVQFLPSLISALMIMLLGIVLAFIVKRIVIRYLSRLSDIFPHPAIRAKLKQIRLKRTAVVIGNVLFWFIVVFFLTMTSEILGLPVISTWLSGIAKYLPNIMIAMLIIFIGLISGMIVRDIIVSTAHTTGVAYGHLLGKGIQFAIIMVTILIAIEQIGIDTAIISGLIYIILGASLFGFSMAFGLGARTSVSNILAVHYLQSKYSKGQRIKIENYEGEILEFTATAVILRTADGEAYIPASLFNTSASQRLYTSDEKPGEKK